MAMQNIVTLWKHAIADGKALIVLAGLSAFAACLLTWSSQGHAVHVEYVEAKTVSFLGFLNFPMERPTEWHATTFDIKNIDEVIAGCAQKCEDEEGQFPEMKLCFWRDPAKKTELCHPIVDPSFGYPFDSTQHLKVESLCEKGCKNSIGLILEARDQFPLSGWVESLWCWVYSPKLHDFVNILPPMLFSDQGEYKIFPNLGNGIQGVIVNANELANWPKEGRYGHHRYLITIYMQGADGYYRKISHYETAVKYPSFDDADEINVIIPELGRIKHLILSKQKKHKK